MAIGNSPPPFLYQSSFFNIIFIQKMCLPTISNTMISCIFSQEKREFLNAPCMFLNHHRKILKCPQIPEMHLWTNLSLS